MSFAIADTGRDREDDLAPSARRVTVIGGTGFLGGRVVRHLLKAGFIVRIASRHPDRAPHRREVPHRTRHSPESHAAEVLRLHLALKG